MGILIEHFAGAFPLWLAPEQVRVLADLGQGCRLRTTVLARLHEQGFRARLDLRPEKIGAKIRDAQLEKIPVMLVVGAKEAESQAVSFRDRVDGDLGRDAAGARRSPRLSRGVRTSRNEPADAHGGRPVPPRKRRKIIPTETFATRTVCSESLGHEQCTVQ